MKRSLALIVLLAGTPAMADVLFDTEGLVTHPGQGFGGADASSYAPPGCTFGSNWNGASSIRIADDFVVDDPDGWQVDSITFYGYSTGHPVPGPSPFTGVNVQIWDGPPDDPASSVVFGDTVTNVLDSSTFSNIYRVGPTTLTANNRGIFSNVATVGTHLPEGTYWFDVQATSTGSAWMPVAQDGVDPDPVEFREGNALQFFSGAWTLATDGCAGLQFAFPFVVEGTAGGGGCYADCDGNQELDFFDFLCFQNEFAAGSAYADCDGTGQLDFFDFLCFQNEFAAGCP